MQSLKVDNVTQFSFSEYGELPEISNENKEYSVLLTFNSTTSGVRAKEVLPQLEYDTVKNW